MVVGRIRRIRIPVKIGLVGERNIDAPVVHTTATVYVDGQAHPDAAFRLRGNFVIAIGAVQTKTAIERVIEYIQVAGIQNPVNTDYRTAVAIDFTREWHRQLVFSKSDLDNASRVNAF